MAIYTYKAKDASGLDVAGEIDASTDGQAVFLLKQKGLTPTKIKEKQKDIELSFLQSNKVKLKDISVFCRQFSTIVNAGVSIIQAIEIMKAQTESKELKKALDIVYEDVRKGKPLSDGMTTAKGAFPEFLISMVKVGELSGNLDDVMVRMAEYYEKDTKVRRKIKSAFSYPIAILAVTIVVVTFLIKVVVPSFVGMMDQNGSSLPLPTKILLGVSNAVQNQGLLILGIIILIVVACVMFAKSDTGIHFNAELVFKLPIIGKIMTKVVTSRFARTLAILLTSGLPIIQSIDILQGVVGNVRVSESLEKTKEDLKKGRGFAKPIGEIKYFPPMLSQMISIGEETGSLDDMLSKTADLYDEEVDAAIAQATTFIEPIIIIFLAVVVGFVIISMILPVFNMYDTMGQ